MENFVKSGKRFRLERVPLNLSEKLFVTDGGFVFLGFQVRFGFDFVTDVVVGLFHTIGRMLRQGEIFVCGVSFYIWSFLKHVILKITFYVHKVYLQS